MDPDAISTKHAPNELGDAYHECFHILPGCLAECGPQIIRRCISYGHLAHEEVLRMQTDHRHGLSGMSRCRRKSL